MVNARTVGGADLRQQTDEALHEQREWLRVPLSSIGDGVITGDNSGGVTFLNPVAQVLLSRERSTPSDAFSITPSFG